MYIQMELCQSSLSDLLKMDFKLTRSQAFLIIKDLTEGLKLIHDKGFVHRDIKPSNILFSSNYQVKIADFGLSISQSRALTPIEASLSEISFDVGTPLYQAPELSQQNSKIDPRADVFSLGVIYFEILSDFFTLHERFTNIKSFLKTREPSASFKAKFGPETALIRRLCSQSPTQRPFCS